MSRSCETTYLLLLATLALTACGGRHIEYDKAHPLHGNVLVFHRPMVYVTGYLKGVQDEESDKYNNELRWLEDTDSVSFHDYTVGFKELHYVPSETRFKVVKSFRVIPWGVAAIDASEYRVLVVEDQQGIRSTFPEFMVNDKINERVAKFHKRVEFLDRLASQRKSCDITVKIRTPLTQIDKDINQRIGDYQKYADFYQGKLKQYDLTNRMVTFEGGADLIAFIYSSEFELGISAITSSNCSQEIAHAVRPCPLICISSQHTQGCSGGCAVPAGNTRPVDVNGVNANVGYWIRGSGLGGAIGDDLQFGMTVRYLRGKELVECSFTVNAMLKGERMQDCGASFGAVHVDVEDQ